jgi:hypothetical protein
MASVDHTVDERNHSIRPESGHTHRPSVSQQIKSWQPEQSTLLAACSVFLIQQCDLIELKFDYIFIFYMSVYVNKLVYKISGIAGGCCGSVGRVKDDVDRVGGSATQPQVEAPSSSSGM